MEEEARYLTPAELVARGRGRVTLATLAAWRTGRIKAGPPFFRVGGPTSPVLYDLKGVIEYERRNTHLRNAGGREARDG